ncbi:MAG TPA: HupE/UreJ family protein [Abditibacteriaceae bacterium]|nr:HupE/UreJ family protein [Abditibacteriaceae bacterium]
MNASATNFVAPMQYGTRGARCIALVLLCLGLAAEAQAHDPGLSAVDLKLNSSGLTAQATYARGDVQVLVPLDAAADGKATTAEFDAARPRLKALAANALQVWFDGKRAPAHAVTVQMGASDTVHFGVNFSGAAGKQLKLRSTLVSRLARGHRQYLTLHNEAGKLIAEQMLSADNAVLQASLAGASTPQGGTPSARAESKPQKFQQFLTLGLEHILTGYDHLLFLFALLIVGGSLREVAKIITSFTLAHSITLALATFSLIRVPANIIEPMIAASIVFVGLENILRRDPEHLQRRWMLTFAFGLVHGCGFASVLRELGIGANGVAAAIPLLSFNLGVELGQIGVAALVLPLIWQLRQRPVFSARYVPACSLLVTAAGAYWFIERTLLSF